jgi:DNA-binding transcriptional ArsR family regulator
MLVIFNQMVVEDAPTLDRVFNALANPTRRAMLRQLAAAERHIGELAEPFKMSFAGASKHLRVLEEAGLVHRRVQGRTHVFRIEPAALAAANEWLRFYERLWNDQLDALDTMLKAEDAAAAAQVTAPLRAAGDPTS